MFFHITEDGNYSRCCKQNSPREKIKIIIIIIITVLRAREVLYKMHLLPQLQALKVSHAQYYVMSETSAALETFFVRELFL